jgi:hypothetical protein
MRVKLYQLHEPGAAAKIKPTEVLYISTSNTPSKRQDNTVEKLCTIKWDAKIDTTSLPTYTNKLGKVYYKLAYELEMTCAAGSVDFAIYHNGKRQASKNVVVDYELKP